MINEIRILLLKMLGKNYLYYVSGHENLPEPLSKEEEYKQLILFSEGSIEARNKLIEHNLRLVVYIAKKFDGSKVGIEDLISIGTIGLIKAINTFNIEKNIKLATYASRCIENEILMFLRKISKRKAEISFDEPLNIDWDGNQLLLSDILGTDSDIVTKNVDHEVKKKLMVDAIKDLDDREQMIMSLRFGLTGGKELTQKDVAEVLGISQSYISRLEKRVIKKLRGDLRSKV